MLAVMAKSRQTTRDEKPSTVMIISEDTSDCTGQGPAQNELQVRKKL